MNQLSHLSTQSAQLPEETNWTWVEHKLFENALAQLDHDSPNLVEQIALQVPGKNASQIKQQLNALIEDIQLIESGVTPLPIYRNRAPEAQSKTSRQSRKRGIPWTPEEHELFLKGLEKYGKGDWRSISRNCVVTRTPTQVASHAQKYFIRIQKSEN